MTINRKWLINEDDLLTEGCFCGFKQEDAAAHGAGQARLRLYEHMR